MNVFDYFFETTKELTKDFVLNKKDRILYDELYENSLKIAGFLSKNVGSGKNVIVISQNNVFFITVYLGVLKSGNICIPLNFAIEQDNLDHILELTSCDYVFTSKAIQNKLSFGDGINIHDENIFGKILSGKHVIAIDKNFKENNLAEIIFTSGSTGEPKGVMISHKNIMANTDSIIRYLKLTSDDTICCVLPFYYCYGLSLLHTHLKVGGSIVLNNSFMFLGTVIDDMLNYKCTGFAGVPSHFQMLLKKSTSFKNTEFPQLRYVTQAGGKLHNVFIEEFVTSFPNIDFFVMYGQTEATARLSYLEPHRVIEKLGSIGKAIPDVELKVVDNAGTEVGINIIGELVAHGDNVMLGYYKDENATKDTLKDGWLYTGDIAKKDNEGYFYITARKKEIIKVGGRRVSPKEIEEVILKVPDVVDCTIEGVDDDLLGESLKALIVIEDLNNKADIKEIILKTCRENLALFKIPQVFEFSNRINVKSTGKK